jgi:hypothetical protein
VRNFAALGVEFDYNFRARAGWRGWGSCTPYSRKTGDGDLDFLRDFLTYMRSRKRYWLLPVVIVLGLFAGLVVLTEGSTIAPFIYALF